MWGKNIYNTSTSLHDVLSPFSTRRNSSREAKQQVKK
jgi:hypothetical protein